MADEIVTQEDGCLVAGDVVHRRLSTSLVSLVQHVVMDQRRHMDQFNDGCQRAMDVSHVAGRLRGKEKQRRSEHFPAIRANGVAQIGDERKIAFDLMRVMRSLYRIDDFQETYFVIDSFDQLFEATRPDFTPYYEELAALPDIPADGTVPEDRLVSLD